MSKISKRKRKAIKLMDNTKSLILKCNKCNRKLEIRVNNLELYTEQVKKNWKCGITCK